MSITRSRFTRRVEDDSARHVFKIVFFEDDLTPPLCHVVQVFIDEAELHNMRTVEGLSNALIERFQHDAQNVPGDRAEIRATIERLLRNQFNV